jgi:hypothetical protein
MQNFCGERSWKSFLGRPYMKRKGNAEVDVGVAWQRLVALAQDYVKDWVSCNPK